MLIMNSSIGNSCVSEYRPALHSVPDRQTCPLNWAIGPLPLRLLWEQDLPDKQSRTYAASASEESNTRLS